MPASDRAIIAGRRVARGALVLGLAMMCCRAAAILAGVTTIPIVQDTRIDSRDTTTNYGSESNIKLIKNSTVGRDGSMVRGLIGLPDFHVMPLDDVYSVKVWLCQYYYYGPPDEGPYTRGVTLYPLTQPFDQKTATWENCNGGQYDATHPVPWSPAPGIGYINGEWWCSWDIKPLWNDSNLRTNGALLMLDPETPPSKFWVTKVFDTSEYFKPEDRPFVEVVQLDQWNGVSGDWTISGNWNTNSPPNVVDAVAGFLGKATQDQTVTVDAPVTLGAILFDNAHRYTLTGTSDNPITMNNLSGAAAITVNNGTHEIAAPIELATNATVTVTNVADTLTLSGDITGTDTGLTKQGSGKLVLSGENSYDGGTSVLAGTLIFGNASALPPGSNVTVGAGGVIVFSSGFAGTITGGTAADGPAASPVPEPCTLLLLAAAAGLPIVLRIGRRTTWGPSQFSFDENGTVPF
jgi:autotransporter-associated beta strand protein